MREHESREPFAYIIQDKYERERGIEGHLSRSHVSKYVSQEDINEHEITCTPLYRHAQQPVVPEEATSDSIEILASARRRDHAVFQWGEDQRNAAADSWNACRATMLQAFPVCTCPSGDGSLRWPCPVHPGNSPVIPDGCVIVPKEPTKEMINAGWLYYMGTKNPSSKGTYKAMLAAAPQGVGDA